MVAARWAVLQHTLRRFSSAHAARVAPAAASVRRALGVCAVGGVGALAYVSAAAAEPQLSAQEVPTDPDEPRHAHTRGVGADGGSRRKVVAVFGGSYNPITNAHLNCAAEIIHSKLADEVWLVPCGARPDKPSLKTSPLHRLIMCHLAVDTTFGSRFGVKVCGEELKYPRAMPSLVLMQHLQKKHPQLEFKFVVGSDLIPTLRDWSAPGCPGAWEEIPDAGEIFYTTTQFLVISRPGSEVDSKLPDNFQWIGAGHQARGLHITETYLSSSEVRHRLSGHYDHGPFEARPIKRRSADDIVRYGLRRNSEPESGSRRNAWYDEAEGLVPASVLGHIVRYGLYSRD